MNYREHTVATVRAGYRNVVGLVVVSILAALALVPLAATTVVGTWLALLGGLWTTCLLLGIVSTAAFRFASVVAERGVPVAVRPNVIPAIRNPVPGILVGVVSFVVLLTSVVLIGVAPEPYRPIASGFVGFLLIAWFLLVAFAAPELGDGRGLSLSIRASADRLVRSPYRVAWFLLLAVVCTLVAGLTVVTLVLFLPGVLALLAASAALGDETDENLTTEE